MLVRVRSHSIAFSFEKKIGIRSTIQKAIRDNSNLGSNNLAKIVSEFPEINPEWLLTGKGEMLRGVAEKKEVPSESLADKIKIIDGLEFKIATLQKDLDLCEEKNKSLAQNSKLDV